LIRIAQWLHLPIPHCIIRSSVDEGHLAAILAGESVVGQEFVDHLLSGREA
jgi:hypothetical protein